jgi:hypothetical protein
VPPRPDLRLRALPGRLWGANRSRDPPPLASGLQPASPWRRVASLASQRYGMTGKLQIDQWDPPDFRNHGPRLQGPNLTVNLGIMKARGLAKAKPPPQPSSPWTAYSGLSSPLVDQAACRVAANLTKLGNSLKLDHLGCNGVFRQPPGSPDCRRAWTQSAITANAHETPRAPRCSVRSQSAPSPSTRASSAGFVGSRGSVSARLGQAGCDREGRGLS